MKFVTKRSYPCQCMDSWKKFHETSLPNKEAFYGSLNMENITDVDYRLKEFNIKTLIIKIQMIIMICMYKVIPYCLQMYLKILQICLKIRELDPAYFYLHQD